MATAKEGLGGRLLASVDDNGKYDDGENGGGNANEVEVHGKLLILMLDMGATLCLSA